MYASDLKWIAKAIELAETSEHPKWRLGCLIIRHSHVSAGVNQLRSPPRNDQYVPTYHAESVALRRAVNGGQGAVAYVARVGRGGKVRMAKPCDVCYAELVEAGVKRVVYTTNNGIAQERIKR